MCPRTDIYNRCRPVKEVQNIQFSLTDIKKTMPATFFSKVARIDFCGNFGDPCMARDFAEISEMLIADHGITIMASTNGSMRRPDWWQRLGRLFAGTESWIEFHIDGLQDTNHLYRIGAKWEKIQANTAAFIAGGGAADWLFILFKHNQHQVEEARETAIRMGFNAFVVTETGRFPDGDEFNYMHPAGDWRNLELATIRDINKLKDSNAVTRPIEDSSSAEDISIDCKSIRKNRFYIDAGGYLAPCCWVCSNDPKRPGDMLRVVSAAGKDAELFNIHSRSIEDILQDNLFSKWFPKLWKAETLSTCLKKCGRRHRNKKIKIEF